jgi:hypothetical protein
MLAVLVISTIGAALIAPPQPTQTPEGEATTSRAKSPPDAENAGRLVEKSVQTASKRPGVVDLRVGDQLELMVRTRAAAQVEIPRLGMLEDAAPDAPAHFSILTGEPARLAVRLAGGRTVAVIRVAEPEAADKAAKPGKPEGAGGRRGER